MLPTIISPLRWGHWGLRQLRLFFIALQFFTRLPIPRWVGFAPEWLQQAPRYFPAVGLVVAAATALVYALAAWIWPQPGQLLPVLLSTIAGICLTGALHEDGFADVCDGFGGGMTAPRVLEIMRDSRIGVYGAIGIGLLVALKCLLLASLPAPQVLAALLVAHPLSRLAALALMWRLPYVRQEGKAQALVSPMSFATFCCGGLTAAIPLLAVGLGGWLSWISIALGVLAATLATAWLARMFVRRIGGYTGDCLGAVQQLTEVAFYLALSAVAGR
ncbi:adenosylcobinamide-GDP ribazoletransferase [Paraherbaspirillum soli]|uniref:Adenosylcobinamide-GDP ribazoletransferase n=1 Tax=Paraherbaspirillum soli TaxID=631222 RepID=A0ABW0MCH7_9BURK